MRVCAHAAPSSRKARCALARIVVKVTKSAKYDGTTACLCAQLCARACVCIYARACALVRVQLCACAYARIYVNLCVCVNTYVRVCPAHV